MKVSVKVTGNVHLLALLMKSMSFTLDAFK